MCTLVTKGLVERTFVLTLAALCPHGIGYQADFPTPQLTPQPFNFLTSLRPALWLPSTPSLTRGPNSGMEVVEGKTWEEFRIPDFEV